MITKRVNADGSVTIGIIEEDAPEVIPVKKKEPVKDAEVKEAKPKTTTKKTAKK